MFCLLAKIITSYKLIINVFLGILTIGLTFLTGTVAKHLVNPDIWGRFFLSGGIAFVITLVISWFVFLNKKEKQFLIDKINKK